MMENDSSVMNASIHASIQAADKKMSFSVEKVMI